MGGEQGYRVERIPRLFDGGTLHRPLGHGTARFCHESVGHSRRLLQVPCSEYEEICPVKGSPAPKSIMVSHRSSRALRVFLGLAWLGSAVAAHAGMAMPTFTDIARARL